MRSRALAITLALLCAWPSTARAHPLSVALLDLDARDDGTVTLTWNLTGPAWLLDRATPVLPAHCLDRAPPLRERLADGVSLHRTLTCGPRGLSGATVGVLGLDGTDTRVLLRYRDARGPTERTLSAADPRALLPRSPDAQGVAWRYLTLGIEHIVTGWDHLAFVLALALTTRSRRALVASITGFTLGHSVTLALAALDLAHLPPRAVEAAIAWSLVVMARAALPSASPSRETPRAMGVAVTALFGALHGFGFAGALAEVGLPRGATVRALVCFNAGVELGQLACVAVGAALWVLARGSTRSKWARPAMAYGVGIAGACALITRILSMVQGS